MHQERTEQTLRRLINSACPRTSVSLEDHTKGSLEVVFAENLRPMDIKPFTANIGDQKVHFYSETENPHLFEKAETLNVADKADYTAVRFRDDSGQVWTMEVFHPKFQEQDLCINRTTGNRTDRFIYTYSQERRALYLSKVNTSFRRDASDRYNHDTISIRIDEDGKPRETRLRLNQGTSFQKDPAEQIRQNSPHYSHVAEFDGTKVLSTYVAIAAKLVFGNFDTISHQVERFEDYVATFEIVGHYYEMPVAGSYRASIEPCTLSHTDLVADTIINESGSIGLYSGDKIILKIDLSSVTGVEVSQQPTADSEKSDVERLYTFGREQITARLMEEVGRIIVTE